MQIKKIGLASFNASHEAFPEVYDCILKKKDVIQVLKSSSWNLVSVQQKQNRLKNFRKLHQIMISAECQSLWIRWDRHIQLLDVLCMTVYNKLQRLELSCNSIVSIQPLQFLQAPNLYQLIISKNFITTLSPLNKTRFPQLSYLQIDSNQIQQLSLNRIKTSSMKSFKYIEPRQPQIPSQDVCCLSKVQSRSFEYKGYCPDNLIVQQNVEKVLQKRSAYRTGEWFQSG